MKYLYFNFHFPDYKLYADNIRKEYNHIPELLFNEGRSKVRGHFCIITSQKKITCRY